LLLSENTGIINLHKIGEKLKMDDFKDNIIDDDTIENTKR
jgi:hypothetical protein